MLSRPDRRLAGSRSSVRSSGVARVTPPRGRRPVRGIVRRRAGGCGNRGSQIRPRLWVPETARTARNLPVRLRQVARHDPLMALRLIYQMFSTLLGWIVLRTRSDTLVFRSFDLSRRPGLDLPTRR